VILRAEIGETLAEIHALADVAIGERLEGRALHDWVDTLLDAVTDGDGEEDADTLDRVADLLDAVIALDVVVPFVGPILEKFDGVVIAAALRWFQGILRPHPSRRARKASERSRRRQARRARRRE